MHDAVAGENESNKESEDHLGLKAKRRREGEQGKGEGEKESGFYNDPLPSHPASRREADFGGRATD